MIFTEDFMFVYPGCFELSFLAVKTNVGPSHQSFVQLRETTCFLLESGRTPK